MKVSIFILVLITLNKINNEYNYKFLNLNI